MNRDDLEAVRRVLLYGNPGTMLQLARGEVNIGLRHDMDNEYRNALKLAQWEHAHGIRASYYVLHSAAYWRDERMELFETLHAIAALGHEVSLHNDAITLALLCGGDPALILFDGLRTLRARGFECVGTAAHGSRASHKAGLVNYDMFAECATDAYRKRWTPRPMADFGLEYEAYHLPYEHYLTESGGTWRQGTPGEITERFVLEGGNLVVLMHPCHWGDAL